MVRNLITKSLWLTAALVLVSALVLGGIAGMMLSRRNQPVFTVAAASIADTPFDKTFAPAVKAAAPAVVNISSSRIVQAPQERSPFFSDPFFRKFFGNGSMGQFGVPRERRERSLGSGVIVSADGYILTNSHVVFEASDIQVVLSDDQQWPASIIGTDPKTDLALLKMDGRGLTSLPLADSSQVQVGDLALAIGNPFGIGSTVTMGIISATGRGNLGIEQYEDFIQTDAAINPGNSGGALINPQGQLIGINTAILSPSGGNLGIGFAVPSNMARHVMTQLAESGKVERGWLGVVIQEITPDLASALNLSSRDGALISDVSPDGPAGGAGLRSGDIVLEANGQKIEDNRQLQLLIAETSPGTKLNMRVLREGRETNVTVTLAQQPPEPRERREQRGAPGSGAQASRDLFDGVALGEMTPAIARQLGLPPNTRGVVVGHVAEASVAAEAGLQAGDVIQQANRQPVSSVAQLEEAVSQAKGPLLLLVNREGVKVFVAVKQAAETTR